VENKKIDLLFGLVVIAFLLVTFLLIKDFKAQRAIDYKEYTATIANIVRQKNDKIKILFSRLMIEVKENEDLRNTLAETRNSLDTLSKRLVQLQNPAPAAPASAPAATVAVKQ